MPAFFLNAAVQLGASVQQRVYLDESGTLGYSGELFTMAMVLVRDLPKLEACTLKNRVTQSEIKASQMKTAQKLALARTLLEQNDIDVYLVRLDPLAAMMCERKLDKEFLYDSMVAQALAFYLERGDMPPGLPYRVSMDIRGGLRESYEDMVGESVANVLMHREVPLVTSLDVRFLDSKYSAGVQAADLFSNIYRTALTQTDSPCLSFLNKFEEAGRVHAGFTFGLPQLADQMDQIASDLRARVELEAQLAAQQTALPAPQPQAEKPSEPFDANATEQSGEAGGSSRGRRSRRSRGSRGQSGAQAAPEQVAEQTAEETAAATNAGAGMPALAPETPAEPTGASVAASEPQAVESDEEAQDSAPVLPFAPAGMGVSRSARRRRARAARREKEATEPAAEQPMAEADATEGSQEAEAVKAEPAGDVAPEQVSADSGESESAEEQDVSGAGTKDAGIEEASADKAVATEPAGSEEQGETQAQGVFDAVTEASVEEAPAEKTDTKPGRASRRRRGAKTAKAAEAQADVTEAAEVTREEAQDAGVGKAATEEAAGAPEPEAEEAAPTKKPARKRTRKPAAKTSGKAGEAANPQAGNAVEPAAEPAPQAEPAAEKPAAPAKPKRTRSRTRKTPTADAGEPTPVPTSEA